MGGGTGGGGPHRAWQAWEVAPDLELRSSLGSPEPDAVPGLSGGRCSRGIPALRAEPELAPGLAGWVPRRACVRITWEV